MLYIFWGEDEFSREEALAELKKNLGDPAMLSANTSVLEGQKLTLNELRAAAEAVPFLAPARVVIMKGLLERFEPKTKVPATRKAAAGPPRSDEAGQFSDCLKNLPPTTVAVLSDPGEPKKLLPQNNPLFTAVMEKAEVRSFPLLRGTKLAQWLEKRINQQGGSISHQAAGLLMEVIGGDLFALNNEVSKLVAYTNGRMIEEKDVRAVVSASQEADMFALIDAVMDRNAGTAEQILEKSLRTGSSPQAVINMIARQVAVLAQVKQLRGQKRPAAEIQSRVAISNPYVWDKASRRADKYPFERLKRTYLRLLKTDLAVKTGAVDGDLALNVLVAELCLP